MKFIFGLIAFVLAFQISHAVEVVVHPPYLKSIEGKRTFINDGENEFVKISRPRIVYTNDEVRFEFEISAESDPHKVCALAKYGSVAYQPKMNSAFFEKSIRVVDSNGKVKPLNSTETIQEIICFLK